MSLDLLEPFKSFELMLKYFATVSWIKSEEITLSFWETISLIAFSAISIVIELLVNDDFAISLFNVPSSSLILESILFAIFAVPEFFQVSFPVKPNLNSLIVSDVTRLLFMR